MADVLVCSHLGDLHTDAVLWGLSELGQSAIHWRPGEFPAGQALSISLGQHGRDRHIIEMDGRSVDLHRVKSVWNRRPRVPSISPSLDLRDRDFVRDQSEQHVEAFVTTACSDALWINTPAVARREFNKPYQLRLAKQVGFKIPHTLLSNSPDEVWAFYTQHGGNVVYKPYKGGKWSEEGLKPGVFVNYTSAVSQEDALNRAALSFSPGIFQARVSKAFEVRVTVMGDTLFCVRINLAEDEQSRLDWRSQGSRLQGFPIEVPAELSNGCLLYMKNAGLTFGCFDFIVSPEMEYHFLEVNQMGQFLWKEELFPELPLLDAMCSFLISGDSKFNYERSSEPLLTFGDYLCSESHERFKARASERRKPAPV